MYVHVHLKLCMRNHDDQAKLINASGTVLASRSKNDRKILLNIFYRLAITFVDFVKHLIHDESTSCIGQKCKFLPIHSKFFIFVFIFAKNENSLPRRI